MKITYLIVSFFTIFYIGCGSSRSTVPKKPYSNIVQKLEVPKDEKIYFGAYADFGT